jgi:hypothetical protein
MRDIKELQVWKEDFLTSLSFDGMDELDEELFLLNNKCENINKIYFVLEDWIDLDANFGLIQSTLISDDFEFFE